MLGALRKVFADQSELALVLLLSGILLILFVPIPSALLDLLLVANFAFALLILMLTFYMARPIEFSTFPSLLLVATLFRLALNIAASRLILSEADAGAVISAVGGIVIGGNYAIGLIVFVVLIIVQYVVVTNGAQRVAEVAARFTLDGMPGKQMSIDADLNMGVITQDEARERRRQIEKEANFYGAMDGASRFVKGDAIAGILIVLVNIIGGLAIGVGQRDMAWGEALATYTLLTVGDGIVTQIPALIIATATGIIVTRAASDARLGAEVSKQVLSHPRTLAIVAVAVLVFGLLPGMPLWPVLLLAPAFALVYVYARRRAAAEAAADGSVEKADAAEAQAGSDELYRSLKVDPVELVIGASLVPLVGEEGRSLAERIGTARKQFALEMGMVLPAVRVRDDKRQPPNHYEVRIFGSRMAEGDLYPDRVLAINPGTVSGSVEGVQTVDPAYGLPAFWIAEERRAAARAAGYTVVDAGTVLLTHLVEVLKQHAHALITRAETEKIVGRLRETQASLVEELVPKVLSYGEVQRVLQALLKERVPIRHLEAILEVLSDLGPKTRDAETLADAVRERLGGLICQQFADAQGEVRVLTLDPAVEQSIATAIRSIDDRPTLILEPRFAEQVVRRLSEEVERMSRDNLRPVLLCAPSLRRHLRRFTERLIPQLAIVSLNEVPSTISLRSHGVLKV
jgi:flagellar biosynthesis protein FlhA